MNSYPTRSNSIAGSSAGSGREDPYRFSAAQTNPSQYDIDPIFRAAPRVQPDTAPAHLKPGYHGPLKPGQNYYWHSTPAPEVITTQTSRSLSLPKSATGPPEVRVVPFVPTQAAVDARLQRSRTQQYSGSSSTSYAAPRAQSAQGVARMSASPTQSLDSASSSMMEYQGLKFVGELQQPKRIIPPSGQYATQTARSAQGAQGTQYTDFRFSQQQPPVTPQAPPAAQPQQSVPPQQYTSQSQQYTQPVQQQPQQQYIPPVQQYIPSPTQPQFSHQLPLVPAQPGVPGYGRPVPYAQTMSSVQTQFVQQTTQMQAAVQPQFVPVPNTAGPGVTQYAPQAQGPPQPQMQPQPGYMQYQYGTAQMQAQAQYVQQTAQMPAAGFAQPMPQAVPPAAHAPAPAPAPAPASAPAAPAAASSSTATADTSSNLNTEGQEESGKSRFFKAAAVATVAGAAEAVFSNMVSEDGAPLVGSLVSGVLNFAFQTKSNKKKKKPTTQQQ